MSAVKGLLVTELYLPPNYNNIAHLGSMCSIYGIILNKEVIHRNDAFWLSTMIIKQGFKGKA